MTKNVEILSHNSYVNEAGSLHVVGEVQNGSPNTVGFVRIIGTFYDANNKVVGTAYTFTQPEDLLSGDIAPFDLILMYSSISVSQIDHYKLRLTWQEISPNGQVTTKTLGDSKYNGIISCISNIATNNL